MSRANLRVQILSATSGKKNSGLYAKLYLGELEWKCKPEDMTSQPVALFEGVGYGSILRVSLRASGALSRSVLGEESVMIDKFFDGKPHEETVAVYSDAEHLTETGSITIRAKIDFPHKEMATAEPAEGGAAATPAESATSAAAVDALAATSWPGTWRATCAVTSVDNADGGSSGTPAGDLAAFKGAGAGAVRGKAGAGKVPSTKSDLKPGVQLPMIWTLVKKPGSYFRGTADSVPAFGEEGTITGSTQRTTGKVTIQMQTTNPGTGVTTGFNFAGTFDAPDVLSGTFSACEISRTATSIAGTFKLCKFTDEAGAGGAAEDETA
jgi:hypothetical protein